MHDPTRCSIPASTPACRSAELTRQFVEHWGMMARAWGINATMGEIFALLYITGTEWTAEELKQWLKVSRGNVSMNLRELLAWGVVAKVHRQGERRELYRAEADVWTLFGRILKERKRRELDPTLAVLEQLSRLSTSEPGLRERVEPLRQFFGLIEELAERFLQLGPEELAQLGQWFSASRVSSPRPQQQPDQLD